MKMVDNIIKELYQVKQVWEIVCLLSFIEEYEFVVYYY